MHRKTGVLEVIALFLEEGISPSLQLEKGLQRAITDFARWQGAQRITFSRLPDGLFSSLRAGLEIDAAS